MDEAEFQAYLDAIKAHASSYPQLLPYYRAAFETIPSLARKTIFQSVLQDW